MLRVLVVDDSATSRELLTHILTSDSNIVVVGTARDGKEAVRLTQDLRPDVITMDIHMPEMNGFEATKQIMIDAPTPTVIVSSSTRIHDVETSMHALEAGALTLLLKPPDPESFGFANAARELVETVKMMADVKVVRHRRRVCVDPVVPFRGAASNALDVRVIAIAASTGGPPALNLLLSGLPSNFPAPILVVQHIARGFVEGFARWLDSNVAVRVKIGEDGESLVPGVVYIAPQDQHLGVQSRGRIQLSDDCPIDGFRPAATYLFRSVAEMFGRRGVAMILTGMGRDGVDGLRAVRESGGLTVAQDEKSSVIFGMPGSAIAENLADTVLSIDRMAKYLSDLVDGTGR